MQEQEKNKSGGMKVIIQEQKKQKGVSVPEQRKGISVLDEAKNPMRHVKNAMVNFTSDAERNLDGEHYRLGDMVWAKVKSHPWWPGQLYDPKLASASALELKRDSCFLVAFFGDSTFGWFTEAELIPFAANFAQKSKQTSAHNFVEAVEDALDEVRRRVKLALTCGCCIPDSTSDDERKPGLLYDRQLHDIRRTFKPAVLFAFMKDFACSPFSAPQNRLKGSIARAQADAFRLLVSSMKASEQEGTQVLSDFVVSNQMKGQAPNDARVPEKSMDKYKAEKGIKRKHMTPVQGLSQEHKDSTGIKSTNEKHGGRDKACKAKQHSMSFSNKKGGTEKSKGFDGEKGGAKANTLEMKGSKPAEMQESGTMDVRAFPESIACTDAFEEGGLRGSGWKAALPEGYDASAALDEVIKNDSSLVNSDSSALNQAKASQTKPEKKLGGPIDKKIVKVPMVDAMELQASTMKPAAIAMKVKASNVNVGQISKIKAVKRAKTVNAEVEQIETNVKNVDQIPKPKRMAGHNFTDGSDIFPVKVKKRKVSPIIACNNESDRSLKGDVVCSSASDYEMQQRVEEVTSDVTGLENDFRQPHVEPLVLMEAAEDVSATHTAEMGSEVDRLRDTALQLTPESHDALAPAVGGPQLLKQGARLEADHTAAPSLQATSSAEVSKKRKKKPKDFSTIEGDALVPIVFGAQPLEQGEQLQAELKPTSYLQAKDSADLSPKKKKKAKIKFSGRPLKPDGDDASVSPVEHLKVGDTMESEQKVESSHRAKNLMDTSKRKKKKQKDPNIVEPLNNEANLNCLAIGDGKENAKSMETFSKVMEDQTSEALLSSAVEVDSRSMGTGGVGSSFESCGAMEALKDIRQKKKEIPAVKYGQEGKKAIKSVKEVKESKGLPPFNKEIVSNKRVFEEREHLLIDSRARSKKVKVDVLEITPKSCEGFQGEDGAEQHEDPTKNRKETVQLQDLHEGVLSVSAKPPEFGRKEVHSAGLMDFTNTRKAVYQESEDSLASVKIANVAVPEASKRTGRETSKVLEAARKQTEVSAERGDQSVNAEGSKVENVRTEKEGEREVLGEGKQSEQDNATTPSKILKKSVSLSKKVLSSSISLRPAIDVKIPVRGSKEILDRFGRRIPRLSDEAERFGSRPSRMNNATVERALMISFPQGFPLPSELEVAEVFAKFGDLNLPLTTIDSRSGCARIIFRRTQDAEAALSCMKENPVYENARFWLKPRDADAGEFPKQSSKHTSNLERLALSCSSKLKVKTGSDTLGSRTGLDKRLSVSTENDIAFDRHRQEKSSIPQNSALRKAVASVKEGGARDAQLSSASEKIPNNANSNAGNERVEGIATGCSNNPASSLSRLPCVGPKYLGTPASSAPQDSALRKAGASAKEGRARDTQLSQSASALEKFSNNASSNAGHESMEVTATACYNADASSSRLPGVGSRSLGTPTSIDISEPFLALLHELHDLVLSIGFKF